MDYTSFKSPQNVNMSKDRRQPTERQQWGGGDCLQRKNVHGAEGIDARGPYRAGGCKGKHAGSH